MYMEDDTMTPRDRISDQMLRRMLDGGQGTDTKEYAPRDGNGTMGMTQRRGTWGLDGYPLASVFAPLQSFRKLYDRDTALQKGTIFEELDLPFMGESVMKGGSCRG